MKVLVHIDQRAALAAGINAPASTSVIDVDPSLLPEDARPVFARFYSFENGNTDIPRCYFYGDQPYPPALIPPITPERWVAAWSAYARTFLAGEKERAAVKEQNETAEEKHRSELRAKLIAGEIGMRGDEAPLGNMEPGNFCESVYGDCVYVKGSIRLQRGADLEAAIAAFHERDASRKAAIKKAKAEAEAARARQQAEVDARTFVHANAEEKEMHARGYLDFDDVRSRLDEEAIEAIRERIEPPGYEITEIDSSFPRIPSSKEEFRLLRRIEQLTGKTAKLSNPKEWSSTVFVEIETTTADGRTLRLAISPVEGDDSK